ncbi:phosphoglycerate mutase family protein [Teladorsagia circumcincta]|uniref:Phosphoglycerate mutase family protein n=1 Tax=Teladorsagia circumcincta TaxID=45464 RepID=A0A2G9U5N0_TELCI|nr:phosphoglycerate mutase family protein [Teladorsagia circumcincta]
MVGLPARGKTYISKKLCRYLNWIGIKTRVFNVGEYRRTEANAADAVHGANASFFSPNNAAALKVRKLRCFFIESVCDDERIIDSNITDVKVNSPDYKGLMSAEQAKEDFLKRIENYKQQYQPIDEVDDEALSFIKHGQSEYNAMGRLGGDSPLTAEGEKYAEALGKFFEKAQISDLRIWCSQKVRAAQTAQKLKSAFHTEYWKALDEIDAGICEGLTYDDIQLRYPKQAEDRARDKYHYRYPSGESYEDVVSRLEPVIMELERQADVLVVSHQAVLRCILAYFYDRSLDELPYIDLGLHSLVKLTPRAYHCDSTLYHYDVSKDQYAMILCVFIFSGLVKNVNFHCAAAHEIKVLHR